MAGKVKRPHEQVSQRKARNNNSKLSAGNVSNK